MKTFEEIMNEIHKRLNNGEFKKSQDMFDAINKEIEENKEGFNQKDKIMLLVRNVNKRTNDFYKKNRDCSENIRREIQTLILRIMQDVNDSLLK